MKTLLLIIIFTFGFSQFTNSQFLVSCGSENLNTGISSSVVFVRADNCGNDFTIAVDETSLDNKESITLEGFLVVNRATSILITGNLKHSIFIKPYIQANTTNKKAVFYKRKLPDERKTVVKTTHEEDKTGFKKPTPINLYPNPVVTTLNIQTQETVLSYRIVNTQGHTLLEGILPTNNSIGVLQLSSGMYAALIQTTKQTVTKTFIKN